MIRLILLASSCTILIALTSDPATAQPRGRGGESKLKTLWTMELKAPCYGGAAVADVDGDQKLEIAFGTYFGDSRVLVLNGEDGTRVWTYDAGNACLDASVRFADVNGDQRLELIVPISNKGEVIAFNARSGEKLWSYGTSPIECTDTPVAILDADGDGRTEVVYGTFKGRLHVIDGKSGKKDRVIDVVKHFIQTGPLVLDCDGDGTKDYVCATFKGDHRVHAVSGKTGKEIWYFQAGKDMYHGCSAGDLDGDQVPELAIAAYDGKIYALKAKDGKKLWEVAPGDRYFMSPTVFVDLDGDGKQEVVAASQKITAIKRSGKILWSVPAGGSKQTWGSVTRGASIADMDGDGAPDVVVLNGNGLLRVVRGRDGKSLYEFDASSLTRKPLSGSSHGPVIADLDGDGRLDVFFVVGGSERPSGGGKPKRHGLAVALSGFRGRGPGWYMLRHDVRNTGNVRTKLTPALLQHLPKKTREVED